MHAGLDSPTDSGLAGYDAEKAAARTAVQAAAGALINVTCQTCDDIVLCAGPREEDSEGVRPLRMQQMSLALHLPQFGTCKPAQRPDQ